MFDIATGQATQIAQHDAPIKVVRWVDTPQAGLLATGSWDKTIKVRVAFYPDSLTNVPHTSTGTCEHPHQWQQ